MDLHLKIIGVLLIALAFLHVIFPKYFNWKNELQSLSLVNRQMIWIHTFFIALIVLFMGVLCLTSSEELINTGLGKKICWGLGFFWGIRLIIQFFGYSPKLWKGKAFETAVHVLFTILWVYLTFVFLKVASGI
jgi:hypothetical protein